MSKSTSKKEIERNPDPEPEQAAQGKDVDTELSVEEQRDSYLASWQRARADYQNLRKRTLTDIEHARRNAKQPLIDGVLLVLDHLEMALASTSDSEEGIRQGVELTRAQILQLLESEGVHPISEGGAFDPSRHEAVATVTDADLGPGQVVETVRCGFTWGEHVLRFAQVKVTGAEAVPGQEDPPESRQ